MDRCWMCKKPKKIYEKGVNYVVDMAFAKVLLSEKIMCL